MHSIDQRLSPDGLTKQEEADRFRLEVAGEADIREGSPSESVWKLTCILCLTTRDPVEIERKMRESALVCGYGVKLLADGREYKLGDQAKKWDRLGTKTVEKALRATEGEWKRREFARQWQTEQIVPRPPLVRSLADFLRDPDALRPPPAVITKTAWVGRITMIASPEGWGKSTYVKAGAAAVTTGQAFLGEVAGPPGDVLWIRVEESEYDLMANAHRFGADPERFIEWVPGDEPLPQVLDAIAARPWRLVVVDSIHEFALRCGATDLDDGAQVSPLLQPLVDATRAVGAAMVWTGQANKATGSYRNSSTFGHMPDVVFEIAEPTDGSSVRKFRQKKSRFDSRGFAVELTATGYRLVVGEPVTEDEPISPSRRKVLDALKPGMTWSEWRKAYGGNESTFSHTVKWLREHGYADLDRATTTYSRNEFQASQALPVDSLPA
jgi:AAA domain-containing protein